MKEISRIFLIDDDSTLNTIHSKLLRAAGYKNRITTFTNAQDALHEIEDLITNEHDDLPQLIFLDIQMPSIDGWQFLKEFERIMLPLPETCKVYMLSSAINPSSETRAKSHKTVAGLIPKPLRQEKLASLFRFG